MKFRLIIFLLLALLPIAVIAEDNPSGDFHPAASENEKTLEYILYQAAKHFDVTSRYDFINTDLSENLLANIRQAQETAIRHNCKGNETLGTNCGLKYNPVTCNLEPPPLYYFHTIKSDEYSASIEVSESMESKIKNKYKLIYADHEWKIDAVKCANGDDYNYDY